MSFIEEIIARTNKVPTINSTHAPNAGQAMARQLDVALMSVGFKLSKELLNVLSNQHPVDVKQTSEHILNVVNKKIGNHVKHNTYFKNFPKNVPDTTEFWAKCITEALFDKNVASTVSLQMSFGLVNLLDLPTYGRYQHSYEEMVSAHDQFIPSAKDKVKILHLGKSLQEETLGLYHLLAGSAVPLSDADRDLLVSLSECCLNDPQPFNIPVRENKAIINSVRIQNEKPLLVDTTTDVLRLVCALSKGDVSLVEKTKFKSLPRSVRRTLMSSLNKVIEESPEKLRDVNQYMEPWKRVGERLHPHEFKKFTHARDVFAVARKDKKIASIAGQIEILLGENNVKESIQLMGNVPGIFFRNLDRVLSLVILDDEKHLFLFMSTVEKTVKKVSGRVILSVREHFQNRMKVDSFRVFANKKGTAWTTKDQRISFSEELINKLLAIFDDEMLNRVPECRHLVVNNNICSLSLPLSEKNKSTGFGIVPKGSITPFDGDILRFFMYWKQTVQRTDYDLSVLLLDKNFGLLEQCSWTRLNGTGMAHSGDITGAPNGASEFIDVNLKSLRKDCVYIVPQVNLFSGEDFTQTEEAFFGFMKRDSMQKGLPYEPKTVEFKSDLRSKGKVSLPVVFMKDGNGWSAKWIHLMLNGSPNFNMVENNKLSTSKLVSAIVGKDYLNMAYLLNLIAKKASKFSVYTQNGDYKSNDITYFGMDVPENVSGKTYSLNNLLEIIPE